MKSKSDLEGGSGNGASIAPLEPGRPDVMPNPGEHPAERDKPGEGSGEMATENDIANEHRNNKVSDGGSP